MAKNDTLILGSKTGLSPYKEDVPSKKYPNALSAIEVELTHEELKETNYLPHFYTKENENVTGNLLNFFNSIWHHRGGACDNVTDESGLVNNTNNLFIADVSRACQGLKVNNYQISSILGIVTAIYIRDIILNL